MATIIIALDLPSSEDALALVDELGDAAGFYKVGSPLFTRAGPDIIRALRDRGKRVFLDLKYHDIPSAVARAVEGAAELEVDLLTVHASGGVAMMGAAREAAGDDGPRLLGVTILTSFRPDDVEQVWERQVRSVRDEVVRLASLAAESGLHGVVTSPLEVEVLKRRIGSDFLVVTPGIRPSGSPLIDQARAASAADAVRSGSDYLVVGRPVLLADDRRAALDGLLAEIADAEGVPS